MGNQAKRKRSPKKVDNPTKFRKKEKEENSIAHSQEKSSQQASVAQQTLPEKAGAQNLSPDVKENQKCKPIMVNLKFQNLNSVLEKIKFKMAPLKKIIANEKTQIICLNAEDKAKLIDKLKESNITYHTFTEV
jgi:hypothetical protein